MRTEAQQELIERYDAHASAYREYWAPVLEVPARQLLEPLRGNAANRVLEIGGGVGSLSQHVRHAFPGAQVISCDISRGMLALAPPELPRAVMDATTLAVAANSVDIALMVFMLFHLEDPLEGLREVSRVLRPNGRMGILTWEGDLESAAMRVWSACLDENGAAPRAEPLEDPVDSPAKLELLLDSAGLQPARIWSAEMASMIPLDHLIGLKTGLGKEKPRYDGLPAAARAACMDMARRRLARLDAEDFVARGSILFAIAENSV